MAHRQSRSILIVWIATLLLAGCARAPMPTSMPAETLPTVIMQEPFRPKGTATSEATIAPNPIFATSSPTASRTLLPTRTPTAPVFQETAPPVVETVQVQDVPTQTLADVAFDFLFIAQGEAYRWSHTDRQVSPLLDDGEAGAGQVVLMTADQRQHKILIHRSKGVAANGVELYDLLLLNYELGDVHTLLSETGRLYALQVSPDGNWVVYFEEPGGGRIHLLGLDAENSSRVIGECGSGEADTCGGMAWSPDSRSLLWADESGIWVYNAERQTSVRALEPQMEIQDGEGNTTPVQVLYSNPTWSPLGRFVFIQVRPDRSQVAWMNVVDLRSGRAAEVPGTFRMHGGRSAGAWLQDGRLAIVAPPTEAGTSMLATYLLRPTREDLLLPESEYQLPEIESEHVFYQDPTTVGSRDLALSQVSTQTISSPGLVLFDMVSGWGERLVSIPSDTIEIAWSPDGNFALIAGSHGSVLLLERKSRQLYAWGGVLPDFSNQFIWCRTNRFGGGA